MRYGLSKEERAHFNALQYTAQYLETSLQQFVGAIITERLGTAPRPDQEVSWKLNEDHTEIMVDINDKDSLYRPTDSE